MCVGMKRDPVDVSEIWQKKIPTTCRSCCWAKFYPNDSQFQFGTREGFELLSNKPAPPIFLCHIWQAIRFLNICNLWFSDIYSTTCLTYTLYCLIGISNLLWPKQNFSHFSPPNSSTLSLPHFSEWYFHSLRCLSQKLRVLEVSLPLKPHHIEVSQC